MSRFGQISVRRVAAVHAVCLLAVVATLMLNSVARAADPAPKTEKEKQVEPSEAPSRRPGGVTRSVKSGS